MVWQVLPASVSSHTVDPLAQKSSLLAPLTHVPIMLSVPILQITWAISVNARQGGKASCVTMTSTNALAIHVRIVGPAQTLLGALSALAERDLLDPIVK